MVDYCRVQGILHSIKNQPEVVSRTDDLKDWAESELDKDIASAQELGLNFQLRLSKEKNFVNTVFVTGINTKSNLLGVGESGCDGSVSFI